MAASPQFIITADDFGYSTAHNHGVAQGFRQGLVTHASLMVNMPGADEASALAAELRVRDNIGCHLNLAEGRPLTERIRNSSTFCSDGVFNEPLLRHRFRPLSYEDRRAVAEETRAQIAAVRRLGCAALHLDSHRYVHTAPNVARVVVAVAEEMRVRRVRPYVTCGPSAAGPKRLGKALFNRWLAFKGLKGVHHFGSIDDVRTLRKNALHALVIEIMTHPALSAEGLVTDGGAGPLQKRLAELEAQFGVPLVATRVRAALR